jgi:cellulose synthase (UDP-forming)
MPFYFERFESRRPPDPLPPSPSRELLYQYLAVVSLCLGAWYLWWRWTESLNRDAMWFAVPLVLAETLAFFGLILFTVNLWRTRDYPLRPPPSSIRDCLDDPDAPDRPVVVDVFFTTYNEEVDLVRIGVRDAKAMRYPHPIDLQIHVLDDGRRPEMRAMSEAEGRGLHHPRQQRGLQGRQPPQRDGASAGDFIIICDADTRPCPPCWSGAWATSATPTWPGCRRRSGSTTCPRGRRCPRRWGVARGAGARGRAAVEAVVGPDPRGRGPVPQRPRRCSTR